MKTHATKHGHEQSEGVVHFFCYAPDAQSVFVAGTFNDWQPDATPMVRDDEGEWETSLPLSPGRYEYKFVVEGKDWVTDPKNLNRIGKYDNSLLWVGPRHK